MGVHIVERGVEMAIRSGWLELFTAPEDMYGICVADVIDGHNFV